MARVRDQQTVFKLSWKKILRGRFVVLVPLALGVLIKWVWVPTVSSMAVEDIAERQGLALQVGDWSAEVFDLSATAHDVIVLARGPFERKEIVEADAIRLDYSLWNRIRAGNWLVGVEVVEPSLYLEQLVSGRWNWQSLIRDSPSGGPAPKDDGRDEPNIRLADTGSSSRKDGDSGHGDRSTADGPDLSIHLYELTIEEMSIEWVQQMAGSSGQGLVHTQQASLFLDDVSGVVQNIRETDDPRAEPTSFVFEARIADGRMSVEGRANLFRWAPAPIRAGVLEANRRSTIWAPSVSANIYLDNVGSGAFNRLVPQEAILPVSGSMSGDIQMAVRDRLVECFADVVLTEVSYAANLDAPAIRGRANEVQAGLQGFVVNGPLSEPCGGNLEDRTFRPIPAIPTAMTRGGIKSAPAVVRAVYVESVAESRAFDEPSMADALIEVGLDAAEAELAEEVGTENAAELTDTAKKKGIGGKIKGIFKKKKKNQDGSD